MMIQSCRTGMNNSSKCILSFLFLSLAFLLPSVALAQPSPISWEIFNKSGTLLASRPFEYISVFDAGWSRSSLCGSSISDCSLEFLISQQSPSPVDGCGLSAELQVDCQSQTSPLNFAQMVCVSNNAQGELIFPQDSPTIAWASTVSMGLGTTGSIGVNIPVVVSNPAVAYISPSRLEEFEAIAIRNTAPSSEYIASKSSSSSSSASSLRDGMTLPTRIVLLNPQGSQSACADVDYFVSVRVVHNALCASYVYFPNSTYIIPGTNSTNSSTVIIPARNITTPVDCLGSHSTCAVTYNDDKRVNYTSVCACDSGYSGSINRGRVRGISDACGVEKSLDVSIPMGEARPPAVVYNGSDPSVNWIGVNTQSTKGRMLTMLGYYLNSSSSPQTYFNMKLNLSRTVQDLSLLLHLTVHPPPSLRTVAGFTLLPVQLQFSPTAYPTLEKNVPLSCLNYSDLIGTASNVAELTYSSSCSSLYQGFPDHITPFASPNSFKLLFQPAFLQGFLNQSNIAPNDMDTQITLYFSLYFQQDLAVDIRTWFEENLQMYVPRMLASNEKKKNAEKQQNNQSQQPPTVQVELSPATSTPSSDPTSSVSSLKSVLAYQNQSWVHHLLENEMIFFHFNDTGTGREEASLVMQINDTSCVSGGATMGFYAPHWWYSANGASALAAGMSPTGLNDMVTPPVEGLPPFMALSGGCFRPNERYSGTAAQNAGIFGQLYTVCETIVELAVWHVLPMELSTDYMNTFYFVELNATGSNCWREFTLAISTSVQNDLLITVDQPDAHILMRLGGYPTMESQYNRTIQQSIPANDDLGGTTWQQHRIAYSDLSHGTYWNLAVYLDPSPGDTVPHPPRAFRIQVSWQTDSSFNHLSTTIIILLACGSGVVLLLIILAVKLRIDACRNKQRGSTASRKSQQSRQQQEKIRLTGQKQQDSYSRL